MRSRYAMTLVEVLLALAILAIIAAVVFPTAAGQLRQGHSAALGNQLANLRDAIGSYRQNVGAFPISLLQLTTQPINGDLDSCGASLSAAERNGWRGPYMNQVISAPIAVGNAFVQTTLERTPATGNPALLRIVATGVDSDIADDLEQKFDGNGNLAAGTILWTAAAAGTLRFQIPIGSC